ncbi:hypothetical protein LCGC14_0788740 [marine sediment metagenome]|uniref:Uncharacterized protein n=1 Tax=marine sediment metagenome TaxID=412755 RepID=A0A0F9T0B9_9ZZZZ
MIYCRDTEDAIKESAEHHKRNLEVLKGKGEFRSLICSRMQIGNTIIHYDDIHCALCMRFYLCSNGSEKCPLVIVGKKCGDGSVWGMLKRATTKDEAICGEENMIRVLMSLTSPTNTKEEVLKKLEEIKQWVERM